MLQVVHGVILNPAYCCCRYDDAVEQTVVNIGLALAGKEIEPEDSEEGG
jgi:hypothetical protein